MNLRTTTLCVFILLFSCNVLADDYDGYESPQYKEKPRSLHLYALKLGGGYAQTGKSSSSIPFIAIADRYDIGDAAIEISMGWGEHKTESGNTMRYFSLPKVTYLAFYNPTHDKSVYYGGGLSWSSIRYRARKANEPDSHFRGIFAEGTIGYELNHNDAIRTMIELNISQPMISNSKRGNHPGPTLILSLNFGF